MSPEISDLLKRTLALSVDERAALANTLLEVLRVRMSLCKRLGIRKALAESKI
jgi:hypothetical protein